MTREEKINEAVERMKALQIMPETIEQFKEGKVSQSISGFMYWIDKNTENNLLEQIKEFEQKHEAVVYYVITTNTNFGLLYNLLFVGNDKSEWEYEREGIAENYVFSYVINNNKPLFSEFGTIGVGQQFGGLIRNA